MSRKLLLVALVLAAAALFLATRAIAADRWPAKYDFAIWRAVQSWWPTYPHADAWKAQLIAESALRPEALSAAGAYGIAQIMPGTRRDLYRQHKIPAKTPSSAELDIDLGARFMGRLRRYFPDMPEEEAWKHARASYNAGPGWILKAWRRCGGQAWADTAPCLQHFTGRHAAETVRYVPRIDEIRSHLSKKGKSTIRPKRGP